MHRQLLYLTILLLTLSVKLHAQTCTHSDLSKQLIFKTTIKRIKLQGLPDSCIISVVVKKKSNNKTIFTARITSEFLLGKNSFVQCNNVRSYTTGIGTDINVIDNDYGDLIIADLNFDGKEDFAIKREEGGNGGPLYNFYLQSSDTTFHLSRYLSNSMVWFPTRIIQEEKCLVTIVHANAYESCETTYKLQEETNKWTIIRKRFVK